MLKVPGLEKVCATVAELDHAVSAVPSPKFHLNITLVPPDAVAVNVAAVLAWAATTGGSGLTITALTATTVHTKLTLATLTPSLTLATTLKSPAVVGVPGMAPVEALRESPAGRPAAL